MTSRRRTKVNKMVYSADKAFTTSVQCDRLSGLSSGKRRNCRISSSSTNTPIRHSARIQTRKMAMCKVRSGRSPRADRKGNWQQKAECNNDTTIEVSQEENGDPNVSSLLISDRREQFQRDCFTPLRTSDLSNHPVLNQLSKTQSTGNRRSAKSKTPPSSPEEYLFADLPDDIRQLYQEKRRINKLYDWQKRCLSDRRLLNGGNVVISLPTGAGKTLVAEVLMLREAIVKKRSCVLVVPYVAIVQEKVQSLRIFEPSLPLLIEEYAASKGRLPPIKRHSKVSLYVATIEKANMLINSLIEHDRIHEIGIVVVDELHMLGESSRGAIIEQALTKFMLRGNGQIVGMSATLANLYEVACFLCASVLSANFRPVELIERVKINNTLFRVENGGRLIPEVDLGENRLAHKDPDGLVPLLQHIIPKRSAIIFCPTKQNCENVCRLLTRLVPKSLRDLHVDERKASIAALTEETDGKLCSTLQMGILAGVAFHHSGLTSDERQLIEHAFQDGVISILCSTSTLAAGVNLPARRVIIKSPMVGREPLTKAQYLQMVGRAGRAGFDDRGDAVTIVHPGLEEITFREMLAAPLMECRSGLTDRSSLSVFLLDLISLKIADSLQSIENIIKRTLFGIQNEDAVKIVEECVADLINKRMIFCNTEGKYSVTTLGAAAFTASIPPFAALTINASLTENLSMGMVLSSHFHLIFTIIPFDVSIDVDWSIFYDEYRLLSKSEQHLLGTMGIQERHVVKCFVERPKLEAGEMTLRLYIAFMMRRVWDEESLWSVAERFHVPRGWLQSVLQSTCSQASSIARFSEKVPQLWPLKHLLPDLVQRLRDCCQQELLPLMAIDGVKRGRARQLYDAGFKTVGAVASADPNTLLSLVEHLNRRQAAMIVNSAQVLIRDQIAEKAEEMEQMGVCAPQFFSELMGRIKSPNRSSHT